MTVWRGKHPLILASQSRARQMLLANAGIRFEAVPADIDERGVQQASRLSAPDEIAALLAREKARCVSVAKARPLCHRRRSDRWRSASVCSASPPAAPQAAEQLRALAGQTP